MFPLTIFTPSYNGAQTLPRVYESLLAQSNLNFEWLIIDDGSNDNTHQLVSLWIQEKKLPIRYIYKENGGLHTGYNMAIENIDSELCVCIDADDFMPSDAVQIILEVWEKQKTLKLAGLIGLDYFADKQIPIGGFFSDTSKPYHFLDIQYRLHHIGDIKMVLRTDLLKPFAPMVSFKNEKNFNPVYYYYKIDPDLKYILLNENLCFVDYQPNGMSANIFYQYRNSPLSFAELRKVSLMHPLVPLKRKFIEASHLVASALIAKDINLIFSSPKKFITFLSIPMGIALYLFILSKTKT